MFSTITVLGVGLIGGSLAMAIRKVLPGASILGVDAEEILAEALKSGIIDAGFTSDRLAESINESDLVVLATPVAQMGHLLREIAPALPEGTVVTDVGSVKQAVCREASDRLRPDNPFIGGHPMAGSEQNGVTHADPFLFENATYVLCPDPRDDSGALERLSDLLGAIGARLIYLEPHQHDTIAAAVSHVPQLSAVALMNLVSAEDDPRFLQLAAGGFRDMTRISSSSFDMWKDVFKTNRAAISARLDQLAQELIRYKDAIDAGDLDLVESAFLSAKGRRSNIPDNMKGFLTPLADAYVYAKDEPGFLYNLTATIYNAGLNIKDLELLKIREGTGGAFRVSFENGEYAETAVEILENAGYRAYRLK